MREIGNLWKNLSENELKKYKALGDADSDRYIGELVQL
jgi:hypothetical protein